MKITILTILPEMLASLHASPIIQHAIAKGILELEVVDIKQFANGSFRHIDDSPYGGGAGMILRYDVLLKALQSVQTEDSYVICPIPAGKPYIQVDAKRYSEKEHLILIAGHYEGLDARIYDHCDALVSLGDYVLSAGEYACMTIADSVVRLQEGVIKRASLEEESFETELLEYPQYTRPLSYNGKDVPQILLSGNHQKIAEWRREQSLQWTKQYRPDLLEQD